MVFEGVAVDSFLEQARSLVLGEHGDGDGEGEEEEEEEDGEGGERVTVEESEAGAIVVLLAPSDLSAMLSQFLLLLRSLLPTIGILLTI